MKPKRQNVLIVVNDFPKNKYIKNHVKSLQDVWLAVNEFPKNKEDCYIGGKFGQCFWGPH